MERSTLTASAGKGRWMSTLIYCNSFISSGILFSKSLRPWPAKECRGVNGTPFSSLRQEKPTLSLGLRRAFFLAYFTLFLCSGIFAQCDPLFAKGDKYTGVSYEYWGGNLLDRDLVNNNDYIINFSLFISRNDSQTNASFVVEHLLERTNEDVQTVGNYEIKKGNNLYLELSSGKIIKLTVTDSRQKIESLLRGAVRFVDTGYFEFQDVGEISSILADLSASPVVSFRLTLSPNRTVEKKVKKKYQKKLQKQMKCVFKIYDWQ
jgi:hypothetical protein